MERVATAWGAPRWSTRRRAILAMVVATLMWSMAGVVTRHLHRQDGLQLVLWRSTFAALGVLLLQTRQSGARGLVRQIRAGGALLWTSAVCWAVMFTAFMLALSLTSVAQTLVAEALGPLVAALLARVILGEALPVRTWGAIVVAMIGLFSMVWRDLHAHLAGPSIEGFAVAMLVPFAAGANWVSLRRAAGGRPMQVAPMLGAALSALAVLPWAALRPMADAHDLAWLAVLGFFQLAQPGVFVIWAAQRLAPAEVGLLGLLEIVFGVTWAWIGAGETPAASTLGGGALILGALAANEALGLWRARRTGP